MEYLIATVLCCFWISIWDSFGWCWRSIHCTACNQPYLRSIIGVNSNDYLNFVRCLRHTCTDICTQRSQWKRSSKLFIYSKRSKNTLIESNLQQFSIGLIMNMNELIYTYNICDIVFFFLQCIYGLWYNGFDDCYQFNRCVVALWAAPNVSFSIAILAPYRTRAQQAMDGYNNNKKIKRNTPEKTMGTHSQTHAYI